MRSAYLAAGADSVKRKAVQERLIKRIEPSLQDFNVEYLDAENLESVTLSNALSSLPFGTPFRVVVVTHAEKITGALADVVLDYVKATSKEANPQIIALFDAENINKRSKLYKEIEKLGKDAFIDCEAVKSWEMPKYTLRLSREYGIDVSSQVAQTLLSRVGENPEAVANALKTLATAFPGQTITEQMVVECIAQTREVKPWEIIDALCNRSFALAFSAINSLDAQGCLAFHRFFADRIRELLCAKEVQERNGTTSTYQIALEFFEGDAGTARNLSWKFKNHDRWSQSFSKKQLKKALLAAEKTEGRLKGTGDEKTAIYEMASTLSY